MQPSHSSSASLTTALALFLLWACLIAAVNGEQASHSSSSVCQTSLPCPLPTSTLHLAGERRGKDDNYKPTESTTTTTTTHASGTVVVSVTTVIVGASPDPKHVYHDMSSGDSSSSGSTNDNGSNSNNDGSNTSANADPNNDGSLEKQLHSDQQALRRMVTILSLVGGIGVVAVVATIVIFTRMRIRKRKLKEQQENADEQEDGGDEDEGDEESGPYPDRQRRRTMPDLVPVVPTTQPNDDDDSVSPQPSAPPAGMVFSDGSLVEAYPLQDRRRHIVSMSSQTASAPSPSAPTAKEVDAMDEAEPCHSGAASADKADTAPSPSSSEEDSLSPFAHCEHTTALTETPLEVPPPAYTPSAPPLYGNMLNSHLAYPPSSPTSSSRLLPSRRHSQS